MAKRNSLQVIHLIFAILHFNFLKLPSTECSTKTVGLHNFSVCNIFFSLAALAQMVACLPLVQRVQGSIPGVVVNFNLKIFNLGTRRGGDETL